MSVLAFLCINFSMAILPQACFILYMEPFNVRSMLKSIRPDLIHFSGSFLFLMFSFWEPFPFGK